MTAPGQQPRRVPTHWPALQGECHRSTSEPASFVRGTKDPPLFCGRDFGCRVGSNGRELDRAGLRNRAITRRMCETAHVGDFLYPSPEGAKSVAFERTCN